LNPVPSYDPVRSFCTDSRPPYRQPTNPFIVTGDAASIEEGHQLLIFLPFPARPIAASGAASFNSIHLFYERHAIDFVQSRLSTEDETKSGLTHASKSFLAGRTPDFRSWLPGDDDLTNIVADFKEFMDRRSATVAGLITGFASDTTVILMAPVLLWVESRLSEFIICRLIESPATLTEEANKPLSKINAMTSSMSMSVLSDVRWHGEFIVFIPCFGNNPRSIFRGC